MLGPGARVVNVASAAQEPIDFDDPMLERGYEPRRAYARSKLAQVLFAFELAGRRQASRLQTGLLFDCLNTNANRVYFVYDQK